MADLSEKEFLKELADLAKGLRRDIDAYSIGLDPSPSAIAERRKRVLFGDFKFFAYTYFPHHIRGDSSLFQAHFCERFPKLLRQKGGTRDWWVAPRGEAKSSLLTKVGPVWCAVQGLLEKPEIRKEIGWEGLPPPFIDYIVLLGAETKLPTKLLEVVKTELTANAALALDFPDVCGKTAVWKVGEFVTKTNVKVEPFGAEQAIRGTFHGASRPKLLLGDDLITDAEAKSPTERENRWNWLEKSIDYLGPPDGSVKYMGVGTILNKDDPISRAKKTIGHLVHHFKAIVQMPTNDDLWAQCEELMHNDDKRTELRLADKGDVVEVESLPSYQFYRRHKKAMDKGAVISWPSVRSLYTLMRARAKSRKAFATEMQGDARSDEDKVFTSYQFWVQRLSHWIFYGGCDPSMGKGQKSHPSALLVGGFDPVSLILHVMYVSRKRRVPSKLAADLIMLQKEFNCQAWGFESVNAYDYMRTEFIDAALRQQVYLPLVGVTTHVPKEVRIDGLEPVISSMSPRILFQADQTQLTDEMDTFPEPQTEHDYDGLDGLQILYATAVSRAGGVPRIVTRSRG
jgi:hypothetical protein